MKMKKKGYAMGGMKKKGMAKGGMVKSTGTMNTGIKTVKNTYK